jgi:hypothetical protein
MCSTCRGRPARHEVLSLTSTHANDYQELYHKTTYDAAIRYSASLEKLVIRLEHQSMSQLLLISKMPAFRKYIKTLQFYIPDPDPGPEDFMRAEDPQQQSYEDFCASIAAVQQSHEAFRASSEAVRLLAECFRNLEDAKNLQLIELFSEHGYSLVFEALRDACFSRKLAYFAIDPNHLAQVGYGALSDTPQAYVPLIRGLQIQPFIDDRARLGFNRSKKEHFENLVGLHIKDYKPTTLEFTKLVLTFFDIDSLELNGCGPFPTLRLCHGCDDLFAKTFAPVLFPNLSSLVITSTYISGSRLRKFVKRHGDTLVTLDIGCAILTDGSWRSIAQGMAKLPRLKKLKLTTLRQKRAAAIISADCARPPNYAAANQVELEDVSHVQHFLEVFVASFSTVLCTSPFRVSRSGRKYFEARLFRLPSVPIPSHRLEAIGVIRRYMEMREGS